MDWKELHLDCLRNNTQKETIQKLLFQTHRAQIKLLQDQKKGIFQQKLYVKYTKREQPKLTNPLLIKKLFSPKKKQFQQLSQEQKLQPEFMTLQNYPLQSLGPPSQDRIHSKCPNIKPYRQKSAFRSYTQCQPRTQSQQTLTVKTALESVQTQNTKNCNYVKPLYTPKPRISHHKKRTSQTDWNIDRWVINNDESKIFLLE